MGEVSGGGSVVVTVSCKKKIKKNCIVNTIRTQGEIQCLPYAGFVFNITLFVHHLTVFPPNKDENVFNITKFVYNITVLISGVVFPTMTVFVA